MLVTLRITLLVEWFTGLSVSRAKSQTTKSLSVLARVEEKWQVLQIQDLDSRQFIGVRNQFPRFINEQIYPPEKPKKKKQSLSEKAHHNTQLHSNLQRAQQIATDIEASGTNIYFQLRQQTAMVITVREQPNETSKSMEAVIQKRKLVKEQLEAERHGNAQLVNFVGALNFMKREDLEDLLGHKVDFDGVLASHPEVARQMELWKRDSDAKDEILEKCKTLLNLVGECGVGEEYERQPEQV